MPSVLVDLPVLNAELYVCRPSAVKTNLLMSKRAVNRAVTAKQADKTNALRQRIRLLGIVAVVVISSIVSRIHAPSGQEQGRTWKAIGAIYPRISDSGEAIVFSYQGAIWRIPRQGGTMHRLTRGPGFDVEPAWSHDGKKIAYINTSSGELGLIDAVSGVPVKLPVKLLAEGKLFFHPDGRRLLGNFRSEASQPQSQVLAWLDLESGTLAPVLNPSRRAEVYSLSPDGERLAFISTQDVEGEQEGHDGPQVDIWTVAAKGGKPEKLVRFRSRIFDLTWGLDGLYFSTDLGGAHNDLWMMSLENPSQARKLTSGQADEDCPSLSADGRWLVYTDNRDNATALVIRDLNTGEEHTLAVSHLGLRAAHSYRSFTGGREGNSPATRGSRRDAAGAGEILRSNRRSVSYYRRTGTLLLLQAKRADGAGRKVSPEGFPWFGISSDTTGVRAGTGRKQDHHAGA